jgi:hypothetical protein
MKPEHQKLNLGCGYRKLEGFWNVDIDPVCNPDEVIDLEVLPWPYEDDFFTKIQANLVLEYLAPDNRLFMKIIQEMYRVSAPKAEWVISMPHHRCDMAYDDFMQVRRLTPRSFSFFDQKRNFEVTAKKVGESTYGMRYNVDLEIADVNFGMIPYWKQKQEAGLIGSAMMEEYLMTKNNVADVVNLFLKVHKPGRFMDWNPAAKRR